MPSVAVAGDKLKQQVKFAKDSPVPFAFNPGSGKDDHLFALDRRKTSDFLAKNARQEGPGNKVASGNCEVSGATMRLRCETLVPGIAKKLRAFLKANKLTFRVEILDKDDNLIEADGEDGEAPAPDPTAEPDRPVGPQDPLEAKWAAAATRIEPALKQALADASPNGQKLNALWQHATAKAAENDYAAALKTVPTLLKYLTRTDREPVRNPDATPPRQHLAARLKEMDPDIRATIAEGVPAAGKLTAARQAIVEAIRDGKTELAGKLLEGVARLLQANQEARAFRSDKQADAFRAGREGQPVQVDTGSETSATQNETDQENDPSEESSSGSEGFGNLGMTGEHRKALADLKTDNEELFQAVMTSLGDLDAGHEVNADPAAHAKLVSDDLYARAYLRDQMEKEKAARKEREKYKTAAQEAVRHLEEAKARVERKRQARDETPNDRKLQAAVSEAKEKRANAEKALEKARTEAAAKKSAHIEALEKLEERQAECDKAEAAARINLQKRQLINALIHGALSADAKPALSETAREQLVAAFAQQPDIVRHAFDLLSQADDPEAFAAHISRVVDLTDAGFSGPNGAPVIDDPEACRNMARNALDMAVRLGGEYMAGFENYYSTDAPDQPDPTGGLDAVGEGEDAGEDLARVATKRANLMADAILDNGELNLGCEAARSARDHLLYHPGSLKTYTPLVTDQVGQFTAYAQDNTEDVNEVLRSCGRAKHRASKAIVRGTLGKQGDEKQVDAEDSRRAVLSAMMTPIRQGAVGSCFATGPMLAQYEADPLSIMRSYAEIATDGTYTPVGGDPVPANRSLPPGEHPLMRSLEYSMSSASANLADSREQKMLRKALLGSGNGLSKLESAVGYSEWHGHGRLAVGSKRDGAKDDGLKTKIAQAIAEKLRISWNSGPRDGDIAGDGDGHSTDGKMELVYTPDPSQPADYQPIRSEEGFVNAMKDIAKTTAGAAEGSELADKIDAALDKSGFLKSIQKSSDIAEYVPWDFQLSGGIETQAIKAITGKDVKETRVVGSVSKGQTTTRVTKLLTAITGQMDGPSMVTAGTSGKNASHAFNLWAGGPGMEEIAPPGTQDKIAEILVKPGKAAAQRVLPRDVAAQLYDEQMRALIAKRYFGEEGMLEVLKAAPKKDMTPAELKAHVAKQLKDRIREIIPVLVNRELARLPPGVSSSKKKEIAKEKLRAMTQLVADGTDELLRKQHPLPVIVFADSNWGDSSRKTVFAASPDPATGELGIYELSLPEGRLETPQGDYAGAMWTVVKTD